MQVRKLFGLSTFAEMLFDVVLAATAILFLVYGILAQLAHGQPIESALHGERLLSASRFVSPSPDCF